MITILNLWFVLTLTASAPAPTAATTPTVTTAATNCWCQTIPMKDWGK
jgi:hypothetical protein